MEGDFTRTLFISEQMWHNKAQINDVSCLKEGENMYTVQGIQDKIAPVCRRYGVDRVFLFGSYVRGEATEQSDIDLRVDLGNQLKGLAVAGFYADMEEALGRRIDIMTTRQLPEEFLRCIASEEVQVYGHSG